MNSENNSHSPINVHPTVGHVSASSVKPSVNQILRHLPDGETPMDVLNNIINRVEEPAVIFNPQKVADDIKQVRDNTPQEKVELKVVEPPSKESLERPSDTEFFDNAVVEERPNSEDLLSLKDPAAENFKKLRNSLQETKKVLKEKEELLEKKSKEVEEYETGKKLPDFIFEKEKRIQELERYEKLHALKTSREYVDNFIKPIEDIKDKLHNLGKEYEVPPEVIDAALNITNRRELNKFLQAHFEDLDAIEAKRLVDEIQNISGKARQAELEPNKVLEELQEKSRLVYQEQEVSRRQKIANNSRKSWVDSLHLIRQEGKAVELISKSDDPDYNEKYVEPILKAAGTEYGKIVATLGELGLTDLPDDLAFALARMTQLAHASAVSIETRQKALNTAETLLKTSQRTTRFLRPPVGEAHASGNGQYTSRPETREDRVNDLLEKGRAAVRSK